MDRVVNSGTPSAAPAWVNDTASYQPSQSTRPSLPLTALNEFRPPVATMRSRLQEKVDTIYYDHRKNPKQAIKLLERESKKAVNPYAKIAIAECLSFTGDPEPNKPLEELIAAPPVTSETEYLARLYYAWALNAQNREHDFKGTPVSLHKHFKQAPPGKKANPDADYILFEQALMKFAWKDIVVACRELKKQLGEDRNLTFFATYAFRRAAEQNATEALYSKAMASGASKQVQTAVLQAIRDPSIKTHNFGLLLSKPEHLRVVLDQLVLDNNFAILRLIFANDEEGPLQHATERKGIEYIHFKAKTLVDLEEYTWAERYLRNLFAARVDPDFAQDTTASAADEILLGDTRLWELYRAAVMALDVSTEADEEATPGVAAYVPAADKLQEFMSDDPFLVDRRERKKILRYITHLAIHSARSSPPIGAYINWAKSAPRNQLEELMVLFKLIMHTPMCYQHLKQHVIMQADTVQGRFLRLANEATSREQFADDWLDNWFRARMTYFRFLYTATVSRLDKEESLDVSFEESALRKMVEEASDAVADDWKKGKKVNAVRRSHLTEFIIIPIAILCRMGAMSKKDEYYIQAAVLLHWVVTAFEFVHITKALKILAIRLHRFLGLSDVAATVYPMLQLKHFLADAQSHWMFDRSAIQDPFATPSAKYHESAVRYHGDIVDEHLKSLVFYDHTMESDGVGMIARGVHLSPFAEKPRDQEIKMRPHEDSFSGMMARIEVLEHKTKSLAKVMMQLELRRTLRLRGGQAINSPFPIADMDALVDKREFGLLTDLENEPTNEREARLMMGPTSGPRRNKAWLRCWLAVDNIQSVIRSQQPMVAWEKLVNADESGLDVPPHDLEIENTAAEDAVLQGWWKLRNVVNIAFLPNLAAAEALARWEKLVVWLKENLPQTSDGAFFGFRVEFEEGVWSEKLQTMLLGLELTIHLRRWCLKVLAGNKDKAVALRVAAVQKVVGDAETAIRSKVEGWKRRTAREMAPAVVAATRENELFVFVARQLGYNARGLPEVAEKYRDARCSALDGVLRVLSAQ